MNKTLSDVLKQVGLQIFLLSVTAVVIFPILWMISIAIDPRNIDQPLTILPQGIVRT
ncbi:MAG: hypothetical protein P8046_10330 [Anaerolineales bacterium]